MARIAYPSDLTDAQWRLIVKRIPPAKLVWELGTGDRQAKRRCRRLCGLAEALDRGTDLRLDRPQYG